MRPPLVEPRFVRGWLAARSLARGLPPPVDDHGGWRVDTRSDDEFARWLFAAPGDGLVALAVSICEPFRALKLLGTAAELLTVLPPGWRAHPPAFFMAAGGRWPESRLPPGYALDHQSAGAAASVRVLDADGHVAASGFAAEADGVFAYDRIVTDPGHRRRGLGAAVMTALRDTRRDPSSRGLLTATPDGRRLYEALGWRILSPYATATFAIRQPPIAGSAATA